MQNREYVFSSEHVIQNRESTSHVRVCESRAHPVFIVGWISFARYAYSCRICLLESFIVTVIHDISKQIKHRARISKIFARWHLAIAVTSSIIVSSCF